MDILARRSNYESLFICYCLELISTEFRLNHRDIPTPMLFSTLQYSSMNLLTMNLVEALDGEFSFDSEGRLGWQNSTDFAACEWTHTV
jgi:hypothetical protein